jgi:manganese peroxidase
VVTCPLGPTTKTFVGRKDSSTPNPEGLLPNPHASGDSLVALFAAKGINPAEISALLGAHSAAKQFEFDPSKADAALDTTPGVWDVVSLEPSISCMGFANPVPQDFYSQVLSNTAPFILPSDTQLAMNSATAPSFKSFVNNQVGWNEAFSLASVFPKYTVFAACR